jgi:putative oxidoreductase
MSAAASSGLLLACGRTLLALIFVLSGLSKLADPSATQAYMQSAGLPGVLLWPTIAFELGFGLLIIVGFQTRLAAILLAGFTVAAGVLFHSKFSDQIQLIMFLKNISIAGGLLLLAASGPGSLSLDKK